MTISITMRDLEANKHSTDQYAVTSMYFNEKDKNDKSIWAMITRKIHVMNELKANILIDNNVLSSKMFDISMLISTAYIENCDVIISSTIFSRKMHTQVIHFIKANLIAFYSKKLISIHKICVSDRDYFFESIETINFFIYVHMMNTKTNFILICNECNKILKILRNFKLEKIMKFKYINVFQIDIAISDMTIKHSKTNHQTSWFQKILTIAATTMNNKTTFYFEKVLFNKITFHVFFDETVTVFINLLNEYFSI